MKLLFDQNISYRILKLIKNVFPKSNQVRKLGLEDETDMTIWKFAKSKGFTIVSYDADFCDISSIKGHPPKIIWLRIGNKPTKDLAKILLRKSDLIIEFCDNIKSPDWAVLEIA